MQPLAKVRHWRPKRCHDTVVITSGDSYRMRAVDGARELIR